MNLLQAALFALFWKLLDLTPTEERESFEVRPYVTVDQALNIWNVTGGDATQRDMMLAAAEGLIPPGTKQNPPFLRRIRWLKLKADSLGRIRNDAAHLVVQFESTGNRLAPAEFAMPASRLSRLSELKRIEDRFRHVVGDMNQLRGYAIGIVVQLNNPRERLPKRPKLRSVPDQK